MGILHRRNAHRRKDGAVFGRINRRAEVISKFDRQIGIIARPDQTLGRIVAENKSQSVRLSLNQIVHERLVDDDVRLEFTGLRVNRPHPLTILLLIPDGGISVDLARVLKLDAGRPDVFIQIPAGPPTRHCQ